MSKKQRFSEFKKIKIPKNRDIVYVICFKTDDGYIPFYVGESSRSIGRVGDYISANFSAPTDFKVGEAIRYLQSKNFSVWMFFKESSNRKEEESDLLDKLRKRYRLLNDFPGYIYTQSNRKKERIKIHKFIEGILKEGGYRSYDKRISLAEVKRRLANKYIKDPKQKDIFLNKATLFKQWANYIAGLVLSESTKEFTPKDIKDVLKNYLIPNQFNRPEAMEGSLLTHDVEVNSRYHGGYPSLKRVSRGRYKFVGF
jgi:hypothetical protein